MENIQTIAQAEAAATELALRLLGGNIRAAARALGVTPATVYAIIKRHGVDVEKIRRGALK